MIRRLAARAAIADLTTCHCGGDVNDRHHQLGVHAPTPKDQSHGH